MTHYLRSRPGVPRLAALLLLLALAAGLPSEAATVSLQVLRPQFSMANPDQPVPVELELRNTLPREVLLQQLAFGQPNVTLRGPLPARLGPYATTTLTAEVRVSRTGLFRSTWTLLMTSAQTPGSATGDIEVGLFLNDLSERADTAQRALAAYSNALATAGSKIAGQAAVSNNRGVLYRLLVEPASAGADLAAALRQADSAGLGLAGIRLNQGVVDSDSGDPATANWDYSIALSEIQSVTGGEAKSSLAPQIYFNQALEAYNAADLTAASSLVAKVFAHGRSTRILKAKAFVLRAGIANRKGNLAAAKSDLNAALSLDPNGPIGRLAKFDLGVITPGQIRFKSATNAVQESARWAVVTLVRTNGSGGGVSVQWSTAGGSATLNSDYRAQSGTVTWADADTADKTFAVEVLDDSLVERDETIVLRLASPAGGATLAAPNTSTLTVLGSGTVLFKQPTFTADELARRGTAVVSRIGGSGEAVSVNWKTTGGSATLGKDYVAQSGVVTWADGDLADKTITVDLLDDTLVEPNETIAIQLTSPAGGVLLGNPSVATLTIPGSGTIQFKQPTFTASELARQGTAVVSRAGGSAEAVTVNWKTAGGSATLGKDYLAQSGVVTWADGDQADKAITVELIDDALVEPDETVVLQLTSPAGGVPLGNPSAATLTIPGSGTLQFKQATFTATEASGSAPIVLSRSGGSSEAVAVTFVTVRASATPGVDFTPQTNVVQWADGDATDKTVTVAIARDSLNEPNETVSLQLRAPTTGVRLGNPAAATLVIVSSAGSEPALAALPAAPDPTATLGTLRYLSDGRLLLPVHAPPGRTWVIEGSADLQEWVPMQRFAGSDDPLEFTVSLPNHPTQCFFRVVAE